MTPAGKLQDYLKHHVQKSGGQYRKLRWEGRGGAPDCLIWWDWPQVAFIEIKAPGDRLRVVQRRERERMQRYGMPVYVAASEADIDEIIEKARLTG